MTTLETIYEAIELLQEAVKDLCNGRYDKADSKIEIVKALLQD